MIELCALASVVDGEITRVDLPDQPPLAVTRLGDRIYAFPDTCPHADASLAEGWIEEGRVVCAVHFAEFELGSGTAHNAPVGCGKLAFYPVTVRDGTVFADLSQAEAA